MTTIAWDGKTVAADGKATSGNFHSHSSAQKIKRIGDVVFAITGVLALFDPFVKWYLDGADPKEAPTKVDDIAFIVFDKGKCFFYLPSVPYPDEQFAPSAWGSGRDFAIGAMHAGADARHAITIAAKCDIYTGGCGVSFDLEGGADV